MLSPSLLLGALRRAEKKLSALGLSSAQHIQKCIDHVATGRLHPSPVVVAVRPHIIVTRKPDSIYPALGEDRIQTRLREADGAKSLLLEIIRRAAYDWVLYRNSNRLEQKQLAREAYIWLFIEEEGHPDWVARMEEGREFTSFISICDALDMDVDRVRFYIRKLTTNRVSSGRLPRAARPAPPIRLIKEVDYDDMILNLLDSVMPREQSN